MQLLADAQQESYHNALHVLDFEYNATKVRYKIKTNLLIGKIVLEKVLFRQFICNRPNQCPVGSALQRC